MAEEIKDTEVKDAEVKDAATETPDEAVKAEESLALKKLTALKEFADAHEITGLQYLQINEANLLINTRLLIEGQTLPLFIVVNNSVYTYLQAHLVTLTEEKKAAALSYLNDLNNEFNMLKYLLQIFAIKAGKCVSRCAFNWSTKAKTNAGSN
uniref:hypothetical protein n=1 Tax=Phascolarctobacterium succinatutens TaxID=626940 RepID=UPI0026F17C2E